MNIKMTTNDSKAMLHDLSCRTLKTDLKKYSDKESEQNHDKLLPSHNQKSKSADILYKNMTLLQSWNLSSSKIPNSLFSMCESNIKDIKFTSNIISNQSTNKQFVLATSSSTSLPSSSFLKSIVSNNKFRNNEDIIARKNQRKRSPSGRLYMSDRKKIFDHLHPRPLFLSTFRITMLQASHIITNYLTDEIEMEYKQEKLLAEGKVTADEVHFYKEEWEEREWNTRWKDFPSKTIHALLKFQTLTILMRFYENFLCDYILKLDVMTMDKLTKDTFASARRKAQRYDTGNSASKNKSISIDVKDSGGKSLLRDMFHTCLWANAMSFLADFTIQQGILTYGYYIYFKSKINKKKAKLHLEKEMEDLDDLKLFKENDEKCESSDNVVISPSEDVDFGGVLLSYLIKSIKITISRGVGLIAASAGGAFGTCISPGWGTLFGTQAGDAMVGALLD